MNTIKNAAQTKDPEPGPVAVGEADVFWLYELTQGEGIYQGRKGPDAEHVIRQTVSGIDEAGEPFCVPCATPAAEQGDAKDAARYRWLVGGKNGVSDRILDSYNGWNGCDGAEGFSAHIDAAILASKPTGEV